jgi:NADH dehydrogenase
LLKIPYDSVILATGASQSYFPHPEFALETPGMKIIDHVLERATYPRCL